MNVFIYLFTAVMSVKSIQLLAIDSNVEFVKMLIFVRTVSELVNTDTHLIVLQSQVSLPFCIKIFYK